MRKIALTLLLLTLTLSGCDESTEPTADAAAPDKGPGADLAQTLDGKTDSRADAPAAPDQALAPDKAAPLPDSSGAPGPALAANTKAGCFGWPAKPFSATNKAKHDVTGLKGSLAVQLFLKDLAGKAYSLSGLLATKPVMLVMGAFT